MDAQELGTFIAQIRKERGLTQAQLAVQLNVTDKAVSKWERGVGIPDIGNLEMLAKALDISLAELIQCQRQEALPEGNDTSEGINSHSDQEVDDLLSAAFDISEYGKRQLYRGVTIGIIIAALGAVLAFLGIYYLMVPGFSIGGANGPTSIYVVARVPRYIPILSLVIGGVVIFAGIFKIFRKQRQ